MTDPTTDPATDALDHFDVDLDDDDLTDTTTTGVDDTENEPSTNGGTTPDDDDVTDGPEPVKGPEPVEVRRARRALKTARAEHRGAISRLRLAEERVVNANGVVKVAAAKAVDLEADEKKKPHQVEAANEAIERAKRACARLEIERDERQAEAAEAAEEIIAADTLLSVALAEAADAATQAAAEAAQDADDGEGEAPQLYYANVAEFFDQYLRHVYQRSIDGTKTFWSAEWWRYDEAVNRLEAVWRAWEHLRLDPATGPSVWWRDHADPHMRVLLSPQGPFRRENEQEAAKYNVHEPLPHTPPPDGLFRDERVVVDPPPPDAPADAPTDP